jgi:nitroreductase
LTLTFADIGEPLPIRPSAETLELLARRRSSPAQALAAPGPSADELETLLRLAVRVPDHGKLTPWRFVVFSAQAKAPLVERLKVLADAQPDPETARAKLRKFESAPTTVLVISRTTPGHKVPEWEQALSAGAVCMNLLIAVQAMGYGANWITDWYAYDPGALALLGVRDGEKVAGFVHMGATAEPPLERARPALADLVTQG